MAALKHHPLIQLTEEEMRKIRQMYGVDDDNQMRDSIETIHNWCQMQQHFVEKDIDRYMIERLFLLTRGSVEGTKKRIDKLFTTKGLIPEIALKRTPDEFESFWRSCSHVPLPKLNPVDLTRVNVTQINDDNLDEVDMLQYIRYCFVIGEYRLQFDYTPAERFIVDLKNLKLMYLTKMNPIAMKKCEVLSSEGFGTKIKGIHIVNAPPFVDKVVFVLKQSLRQKVANRLFVHHTNEELQEHISKEVLPKDYGGEEQTVEKLQEHWKDELKSEKARKLMEDLDRMVTDESKRSSIKFNEEYMGMPGSFRRLNVD